jgi:hypothetical protein
MSSVDEAWLRPEGVFISGKPLTDIWAAPGLRWKAVLEDHLTGSLQHPHLAFTRNDRSRFDLDNLAYPVLAVLGCPTCESLWASVSEGAVEGVLVRAEVPPRPLETAIVCRVHIDQPSVGSIRGRPPVPELSNVGAVGTNEPLGLSPQFDDPAVAVGELSYEGPVKSLIDDLTPLFGEQLIAGRMLAMDHRVRELRLTRGHEPTRAGVTLSLWYL